MSKEREFSIYDSDSVYDVQLALRLELLPKLRWSRSAEGVIFKAVEVLVDYVLRHGGGVLYVKPNGHGLELWTRDQEHSVLRTFASVREAGISPPTQAGLFEIPTTAHGGLNGLRQLVDEVRISHFPDYRTEVRAIFLREPSGTPHAPCPCIIEAVDEEHGGFSRH